MDKSTLFYVLTHESASPDQYHDLIDAIVTRLPSCEKEFDCLTYPEMTDYAQELYFLFKEFGVDAQAVLVLNAFRSLIETKTSLCWLKAKHDLLVDSHSTQTGKTNESKNTE